MLEIVIPGAQRLRLSHLVLDYNGTLAKDGSILPGVAERLDTLSGLLEIHIVTADTFGSVRAQTKGLSVEVAVIARENQAKAKADYLNALGAANSVAIGNGRNDTLLLKQASLGIAVLQTEGAAAAALMAADAIAPGITEALDLLLFPNRLRATLRS